MATAGSAVKGYVAAGGPCYPDPCSATAWLWAERVVGLLFLGVVPHLPTDASPRPVGGTNPPVSSARAARQTPKFAAAGATGLRACSREAQLLETLARSRFIWIYLDCMGSSRYATILRNIKTFSLRERKLISCGSRFLSSQCRLAAPGRISR